MTNLGVLCPHPPRNILGYDIAGYPVAALPKYVKRIGRGRDVDNLACVPIEHILILLVTDLFQCEGGIPLEPECAIEMKISPTSEPRGSQTVEENLDLSLSHINNQIGYSRRSSQIWGVSAWSETHLRSIPNIAFVLYATSLSSFFSLFQGWVACGDCESHLSAGR